MADGRKLKPYVVFKGVRAIPKLNTTGVVEALSKNGWMNEELTKDWVKRAWGSPDFGCWLLVWDAYKYHITADVRSCVNKQTNTDVSVIPGDLTSHLQPADVSWNKPFKTAYKEKYSQWMATDPKTYTADGNVQCTCSQQSGVPPVDEGVLGGTFSGNRPEGLLCVWNVCESQMGWMNKKSTASRKVEWLQMPGSQFEETVPYLPLQWIPSLRNQTHLQVLKRTKMNWRRMNLF